MVNIEYTQAQTYALADHLKQKLGYDGEQLLAQLEACFCIEIHTRNPGLLIHFNENSKIDQALNALDQIKFRLMQQNPIDSRFIQNLLQIELNPGNASQSTPKNWQSRPILRTRQGVNIEAKSAGQAQLVELLDEKDIILANGPAGTGKTFLAVALAVAWLEERRVDKLCLVRPAVEAGESLGFLPGDPKEKIAPYLRPIYDTLNELLPPDKLARYHEAGQIEIAPLAYMRGRTLKRSFIILDEAQNATIAQMKMFLTRLGHGSKAIITGDTTQSDLQRKIPSGFAHALHILEPVKGIGKVHLQQTEVLRHPLVQDILRAYGDEL